MPVRITNRLKHPYPLPIPISLTLKPFEVRVFPYIEYDKLMNDPRFVLPIKNNHLIIEDLTTGAAGVFVAQWDLEPKLRLIPYVFWVDATNVLRMKIGDPGFDLDGIAIGPGVVGAHGSTHVYTGTDPIPRIEVLEGSWTCTVSEVLLNVVYEAGSSFVRQANAAVVGNMPAIGVVIQTTGASCVLARSGEVDGFVGLTPGATYFVSTVAGQITTTPPSGSGNVVQRVGYAKTTTILMVQLGEPAKRA